MIGLTRKQRQLYDFIAAEIAAKGVAPSLREMADGLGLASKSNSHWLLRQLEDRGAIRRIARKDRAIELVPVAPTVTLNTEILTLTDRYAAQESISRDTATNQIMREWLEAYFRRAA